jgi:hypothetical protein
MALLWCDNFQQYGTGYEPSPMTEGEVYGETSEIYVEVDPDPSGSDLVLRIHNNVGSGDHGALRKVLPASETTLGCGFRLWLDNLPLIEAQQPLIFVARDGANADICGVSVRTDGYLIARTGTGLTTATNGTVIGTSSGPAITAGAWQQVEIKMVLDAVAGSVEVRVDGVVKLNLTGVNTGTGPMTQIAHTLAAANSNWYMKDYFIWNTSGSINNTFFGNCFVHSMIPDGDVSGTWSLTGAANAYQAIDEVDPDDDTTYISSAWPAATAEVVTVSDLPPEATRVIGLMSLVRAIKTDGGDADLVASLVSTTNTVDGATTPITTAYAYWADVFETDPDTSAAWSVAAANAVKLKLNRTA